MSERLRAGLPPLVELLGELTWDQLRPMAEHHGIPVVGRRREPLVERLQAALTDPAHLEATVQVLGVGARALLGLLLLRGGTARTAEIDGWRQALRRARTDLEPSLALLRSTSDAAVLAALGLAFRKHDPGRRGVSRLLVPADVLDRLPPLLAAATSAGPASIPRAFGRMYAEVGCVVAALEAQDRRAGRIAPARAGQPGDSEALLMVDELHVLAARSGLSQDAVMRWLEFLSRSGALRIARGRWEVDDRRLGELRAPDALLPWVRDSWLEAGGSPEAGAWRRHLWRLVASLGPGAWHVAALRATLEAVGVDRPERLAEQDGTGPGLVMEALRELESLGLIAVEDNRFVLAGGTTPVMPEPDKPRIAVTLDAVLVRNPDGLPRATFDLLEGLGSARLGEDGALIWEMSRASIVRLLQHGGGIVELYAALREYGELPDDFVRATGELAVAAARIQLHYPLPVLVASDPATLQHLVGAAELGQVTARLGDRALIVEPSEADAIFERLQKRGFWPRRAND